MSDLIKQCQLSAASDGPLCQPTPVLQKIPTRIAQIGESLTIRRALPHRERRTIGAWCFLDHFGPLDLKTGEMDIAPHPHIGLQTFTWTLSGEIMHRDSIGSEQIIQPGQINLMTAGKGISHSEESLPDTLLHGVQLWIALPDMVRHMEPQFHHYASVPTFKHNGLTISVLVGEFMGQVAPTKVYSSLISLDIAADSAIDTTLPLDPNFEYGILPLVDQAEIGGEIVTQDSLLYLGKGRTQLHVNLPASSRLLLIGGEPFNEEILIWWNFVARTKEELVAATDAWNEGSAFGKVEGYHAGRLTAPPLT